MSYRGNRKTRRRRRTRRRWSRLLLTNLLLLFVLALVLRAGAALSRGETLKGEDGASNEVTKEGKEATEANGTKEADGRGGGTPGTVTSAAGKSKKTEQWNLILVNPWNEVPEDYEVKLTRLKNGQAVDSRCYPMLQQMMDDCRAAGLNPVICSSYRTHDKQEELFRKKVNTLRKQGYSQEEAETEAARWVARPGTSEHETGLAVDIVDKSYQLLDEKQEQTPVQQWLMAHCAEYGFILRYPVEKSDLTGIGYEPWHYRYVGVEAAKAITEQGLCLEEYWMGQTEPLQQEYSVQAAPDPVETQG